MTLFGAQLTPTLKARKPFFGLTEDIRTILCLKTSYLGLKIHGPLNKNKNSAELITKERLLY